MKPADHPPPFDPADYVTPPTDPADEQIEVGVLIVGAGPAGLACAIRLGQLLEEQPELAARLGDVPVAVLEKGKQPGSHLLSGAVVNPRGLQRLFRGRKRLDELPFLGVVEHESVYFLTPNHAVRLVTPPTMKNQRNYVASLSQLGRWLGEQAEEAGATILPETAGYKLLVSDGRVLGVRTGDKGRGRNGEELANFEPGSDIRARVTVLAEGTQGPSDGSRARALRAPGREPAGLGARRQGGVEGREAPRPRHPHPGLAAAAEGPLPRVRGLLHLPDGRGHGHHRHGRGPRLPRRPAVRPRPAAGAEDALARPRSPRRRGARRVGSEDDSRGRTALAPEPAARSGPADHRRRRRLRQRPGAQGHPLRGRVGAPRGGGGLPRDRARRDAVAAGRARLLRRVRARKLHLEGPAGGAEHAPGLRTRVLDGLGAGGDDDGDEGQAAAGAVSHRARIRSTTSSVPAGRRSTRSRTGS